MQTHSGSFGHRADTLQCTAMSKRSRERCKGPAVAGSPNQKCRMHGGHGGHAIGKNNASFKDGRHSKYLPANLNEKYTEALANPDLLDMSDHVALLEARIQDRLAASKAGDPAPEWHQVAAEFGVLETEILAKLGGDAEICAALERMHKLLDAGEKWDQTWMQVGDTMEQLRKMTDTEVKRRKELHLMVPVERVMILVEAVGQAVKRNVTNPIEIQAVHRELSILVGSAYAPAKHVERVGPEVIDVQPARKGKTRKALKREREREEALQPVVEGEAHGV